MKAKLYFSKRIAEPKQMEKAEMLVFEKLAKGNYHRWVLPLVMDASRYLVTGEAKILDIGCGPGLLTKGFAEHNKQWSVTGADISNHALTLAKKNCRGLANAGFKKSSVYKLTFKDGQFDLVVCKDSFHHFNNPTAALKEMLRVVKPGGALYLQDLRRDLPMYLLKRALPPIDPIQKLQYFSARAAYTKAEVAKILRSLKISKFKISTQRLTKNLQKEFSHLGLLSPQLKEGFQARYLLTAKK